MKVHSVKAAMYSGSDYEDIYPKARKLYRDITKGSRRQPYVRSSYFKNDKVFIELFWIHLNQKSQKERRKRLRYFAAAIELLRDTKQVPTIKTNPGKNHEILYRFAGITSLKDLFYVQVKEDSRSGRKDFMSVFPEK